MWGKWEPLRRIRTEEERELGRVPAVSGGVEAFSRHPNAFLMFLG